MIVCDYYQLFMWRQFNVIEDYIFWGVFHLHSIDSIQKANNTPLDDLFNELKSHLADDKPSAMVSDRPVAFALL